jgi:nucleotide-binding universal stress UspA family protein
VKEGHVTQSHNEQEHRIVVGVDGSDPSKAALAWAIAQAGLTGAVIDAVIAWEFPANFGYPVPATAGIDFEEIATEVIDDAVGEVASVTGPVKVRPRVVKGNPAQVLLNESAGADLLVVGSRGHGGFIEALLGSVGQHCVHYATCPVLVIRDSHPDRQ